jgi:hypothetical protein
MSQGPTNPNIRYPWQQAVLEAFMEFRSDILPRKINEAQHAISARLCDSAPPDLEEQQALRDAMQSLHVLMSEQRTRGGAHEQSAPKKDIA